MIPTQTLQKIVSKIPTTTRIPPRPIPALPPPVLSGVATIVLRSSQTSVGVLVPTHVLRYASHHRSTAFRERRLVTHAARAYWWGWGRA